MVSLSPRPLADEDKFLDDQPGERGGRTHPSNTQHLPVLTFFLVRRCRVGEGWAERSPHAQHGEPRTEIPWLGSMFKS